MRTNPKPKKRKEKKMTSPLFRVALTALRELAKAEGVKAVENALLVTKLLETDLVTAKEPKLDAPGPHN